MIPRPSVLCLVVSAGLLGVSPISAGADSGTQAEATVTVSGGQEVGSRLVLFPSRHLFPVHLADPRSNGFALMWMSYSDPGIADSGSPRFGLKLGGRFGVLRIHPEGRPDRGWQISIEAAFYGQFDSEHNLDNIGWDGIYGLTVSHPLSDELVVKVGILHTSSHVGDEYAERTGRLRINYTREESLAGLSWAFAPRWRAYGEVAYGHELRNRALQAPWRIQTGLEYVARDRLWKRRLGWYAAIDSSAVEERDWRVDTSIQAGFLLLAADRRWRLGVEYYDGRVPIGEFFQDHEAYTAFGLWLDL